MKLFLYTDSAQVDAAAKKSLLKASYLPIRVADFGAIKVVEPLPDLTGEQLDIITRAALEAIQKQGVTLDARTAFGSALARMLSTKPAEKPTA